MRTFAVRLPSGKRYWTVLDEGWEPVEPADRFLREVRFGKDRAESTTRAYAGALVLFLRWCEATGRDWRMACADFASFMIWLRYVPTGAEDAVVRPGPGSVPVRGERRINVVLIAVRAFLLFAVRAGDASAGVVEQLYEVGDARDLPVPARGENDRQRYRLAARHRLREPQRPVRRASDEEIVALIRVAWSARDRLVVLLMARAGLRRGEVVGLRRSDLHLLVDNAGVGCRVGGAHLHVEQRDNPNGAQAKSRHARVVPLDHLVVQALDLYAAEREQCRKAQACDFVLVNLFRAPVGSPLRVGAINELITSLARRAGLGTDLTPHTARHAFASNVLDAGASLDEVQHLLGHGRPDSSQIYLHPDPARLRGAVERVGSPRVGDVRVTR